MFPFFIDLQVMTLITISPTEAGRPLGGFCQKLFNDLSLLFSAVSPCSFNHRQKKLNKFNFDKNVRLNLIMAWFKMSQFLDQYSACNKNR